MKQAIMLKMKIFILSVLASLATGESQAQTKLEVNKSNFRRANEKLVPRSTPAEVETRSTKVPAPPPPAGKTSSPEIAIYALTAVRVKIRTGNDNKEFPSQVLVTLKPRSTPKGDWSPFAQLNLNNEMKINSDTEFGLERNAQLRGAAELDSFQTSGLVLEILYLPNFFADAWKIENISLVLEFKDQHGNLHPTLGNKTIVFSNAYGFLNNEFRRMECVTDKLFAPMTAAITK